MIPTAEEFLLSFDKDLRKQIAPYMRQFTQMHVKAALLAVIKNREGVLNPTNEYIISSYPLNLIK